MSLLAASALAACATTGQHAVVAAGASSTNMALNDPNNMTPTPASAAQHPARAAPPRHPDRHAREEIAHQDALTQMAFWASEYDTFPNDLEAAQHFSDALRRGGRADRAVTVAQEALQRFPNDKPLMLTLGLAQIANRDPQDAVQPLTTIAAGDPQDWRVRSALGAALDQVGRYNDARASYQQALAIRPNDPGVLTNLGVSHLMEGDPAAAEPFLRQAAAQPNAPAEARQNLAIAVALQGHFDEAQRLEQADLPPAQAAANLEYLRGLLSDPHRWGDVGQRSGR
jgi:Flp pilus assembly protein TadD